MTSSCPLCGAPLAWRVEPQVPAGHGVIHAPRRAYDEHGPHAEVCPANPFNTEGPLDLRAAFARLSVVTGGRATELVGGAA